MGVVDRWELERSCWMVQGLPSRGCRAWCVAGGSWRKGWRTAGDAWACPWCMGTRVSKTQGEVVLVLGDGTLAMLAATCAGRGNNELLGMPAWS